MPRPAPARVLLAPALLLVLTACGAGTSTVSPGADPAPAGSAVPPSQSAGSAPAAPVADRVFQIAFADGKATGDTGRLEVALGDSVSITVTSQRADEVHVHGYDATAPVTPDAPAVLVFDAKIPGVFEVELEDLGVELATLQVQ